MPCASAALAVDPLEPLAARVARDVADSGARSGTVTVFVVGSTAGVTTIEFEPGLQQDLPELQLGFFQQFKPFSTQFRCHAAYTRHISSRVLAAFGNPNRDRITKICCDDGD